MPICKFCGQEFSRSVFVHHLPWCESEHKNKEPEVTKENLEKMNMNELREFVEKNNLQSSSRARKELIEEILEEIALRG